MSTREDLIRLLSDPGTAPPDPEDPRQSLIRMLSEEDRIVETPSVGDLIKAIPATVASLVRSGANPLVVDPTTAAMAAGAVSTLEGAAQALFEIPGLFVDKKIFTDKYAEAIREHRLDLEDAATKHARNMGVSSAQIAVAKGAGNLIGFAAPGAASVKLGTLALGFQSSLRSYPLLGNVVTDVAAGMIYGGLFSPDNTIISQRAKSMFMEGGIGGAFGLVFRGPAAAVFSYRYSRAIQQAQIGEVEELLKVLAKAREHKITLNPKQAELAMSVLSEENFITNSPAAQDILARAADETAFVHAIMDVAQSRATHGIVRNVNDRSILTRLMAEFPSLDFRPVKRELADGTPTFDIFFGVKGLNNKQVAQFKNEGRFAGQRVLVNGAEMEYVGLGDDLLNFKVKTLDSGQEFDVPMEQLSDMPFGVPVDERTPEMTAFFDDFQNWFFRRANELSDSRTTLSEQEIRAGLADGSIRLDHLLRRDLNVPGSIMHPKDMEGFLTKVLDEQGRPKMVFHGTSRAYDVMEIERTDPVALYGPGHYFTENPEIASTYTNKGQPQDTLADLERKKDTVSQILQMLKEEKFDELNNFTGAGGGAWGGSTFDDLKLRKENDYAGYRERLAEVIEGYEGTISRYQKEIDLYMDGTYAPNVRIAHLDIRQPFDMDAPVDPQLIDEIERFVDNEFAHIRGVGNEFRNLIEGRHVEFETMQMMMEGDPTNGELLWDALRYIGMKYKPGSYAYEYPQRILKSLGYDGITHTGGAITGGTRHKVWIAWDDAQVKVPGSLERKVLADPDSFVGILNAPEMYSFEEAVQEWMMQRGLPLDANGAIEMSASFAQQMREKMWKLLPDDEKFILDNLREQYMTALNNAGTDIHMLAGVRGFRAEQIGDAWALRDINTGASFHLESEDAVRAALQHMKRGDHDFFGGILPQDLTAGQLMMPEGIPDVDWFPEGVSIMSELADAIPPNIFRNVRDYLIGVEERTGIPLWSQGFEKIDRGLSQMRNDYLPWASQIEGAFKGFKRKERIKIARFWQQIEGKEVSLAEQFEIGKKLGMDERHFAAAQKLRKLWDAGFALSGIDDARYIEHYYGRIMPWAQNHGGMVDLHQIFPEGVPPSASFWAEMSRTGELAITEEDPAIVMHKWFRSLFFKKNVKEHWDRMAQLTGHGYGRYETPPLRVKDLSPDQRARLAPEFGDFGDETPVLPATLQKVLREYLTVVRGFPGHGMSMSREYMRRFMKLLGVKGDERIVDEYINSGMSTMYGAAMGLRPSIMNRDFTQNLWMLYTRIGGKHISSGLDAAFTREGFEEAVKEGAIRMTEAGVPYSDVIFETIMEGKPVGTGPASWAVAGVMRAGLRAGEISRHVAHKMMTPYAHTGHLNRAWAYHSQKQFTAEWLGKYEAKRISQETFIEDGLPFFSKAVKEQFMELYDKLGREQALRFIGKMGADEANFIYGVGAQPAWMQTTFGRFLGMFGTYPMWANEMYFRRLWNGTGKQKALFALRNAAVTTAVATIAVETGINIWNWITPATFMNWGGGPMVQHLANLSQLLSAPVDQKAERAKRLGRDLAGLWFPGQVFVADVKTAIKTAGNPAGAAMMVMLGRPVDDQHFAMEHVLSPSTPVTSEAYDPDTIRWLERPRGNRPDFTPEEMGLFPNRPSTGASVSGSANASHSLPDILQLLGGNK